MRRGENKKYRDALLLIAEECENHPLYMEGATDKELCSVGGDAALITYWAQIARESLEGEK